MNFAPAGPHFVDTSAVIMMMRARAPAGSNALIPFATQAELLTGTHRAAHPELERVRVRLTLGAARVIYPTARTLACYGRLSAQLLGVGRPLPANDLWNAALALEWDLPLLADDAHFTRVPGLKFITVR